MQTSSKKCKTSLKVSVTEVKTEISSSPISSRFYPAELNSSFGLSSSIQTSLTAELNRVESKLVCPKLLFLYCRVQETSFKKSRLSSSGVKFVFSIKTANAMTL